MPNPTPNRPLWRVMRQADSSAASDYQSPEARMLRAIADEVERRGDKKLDLDPGETADWLRAEADRAEAGE